ncbi:helix-turn-helix domain-containing protein [uncultured Jatrophihabitans sp.]|uniref:helix-turn-helix domain-containing protein n=1 Tax=uncultured Jatrophihabitans sp. TaxID=1610747 RepID=UPI0035CA4818
MLVHVSTARDLGLLVRQRRQDLRLSQADLATRAGVGRPWVVAVEKGHARAELGKLLALLAELGLAVDLSAAGQPRAGDHSDAVDLDELLHEHDRRSSTSSNHRWNTWLTKS